VATGVSFWQSLPCTSRQTLQPACSHIKGYHSYFVVGNLRGSQWPCGLRHEMSSPARTLGSWVRIPLEAWMFVFVYSVFVLSCVGSGLATGWSLVQGVLPIVYKCKIKEPHKRRPRPDMGCKRHWMVMFVEKWNRVLNFASCWIRLHGYLLMTLCKLRVVRGQYGWKSNWIINVMQNVVISI
jgi:hypothetical protein